jgi:hypothetical protein
VVYIFSLAQKLSAVKTSKPQTSLQAGKDLDLAAYHGERISSKDEIRSKPKQQSPTGHEAVRRRLWNIYDNGNRNIVA